MLFTVFKAPAEGRTHIFRPHQPFAQIIVIPEEAHFELEQMGEEESAERELQARRIYANRSALSAGTEWTSSTDTVFDGTPRCSKRCWPASGRTTACTTWMPSHRWVRIQKGRSLMKPAKKIPKTETSPERSA